MNAVGNGVETVIPINPGQQPPPSPGTPPPPKKDESQLKADHEKLSARKREQDARLSARAAAANKKNNQPKGEGNESATADKTAVPNYDDFKNDDVPFSSEDIIRAIHANEAGDAMVLVAVLKGKFLYDHNAKEWYYWNDHHWRLDIVNNILSSTQKIVDVYESVKLRIMAFLSSGANGDETLIERAKGHIKMISERVRELQTYRRKTSVLNLARSGVGSLAKPDNRWDTKPDILVVKNGVVDLKTGQLIPGDPADYMLTSANVPLNSINDIPERWEKFLSEIFDCDAEIINYIHVLLGYGITGHTHENVYPIFYGPRGQNGKTTILETLKFVLGDYAYKTPDEYFIKGKYSHTDSGKGPDAATMDMIGKRISWSSEINENERLDVKRVKAFSGQDTVTARGIHAKRQVQFKPSVLPIILLNHKPEAPPGDDALWKRLHLITFNFTYIPNPDPADRTQRKRDESLGAALQVEGSKILAWLVRGAMRWYREGLKVPEKIKLATEEYRSEEDILGLFLSECTLKIEGQYTSCKRMFDCFVSYCKSNNFKNRHTNIRDFGNEMVRRKLSDGKKNKIVNGQKSFPNIIITVESENEYLGVIS